MNVKRVVLVEGADDEHVVKALCGRHKLGEYHIRALGGVETLLQRFPIHLQGSDISSLAIIVDADGNPAARRDSMFPRAL